MLSAPTFIFAQVGIGTNSPATSAQLDVSSTTKGFLPPRMTSAQRSAIGSLTAGLMVYQTDATAGLYYYNGSAWIYIINATTNVLSVTNGGTGVTTSTGSGSVVLSTSPSFTTPSIGAATATSLVSPTITGGTGTTQTLTYKTTTGIGATGADHIFQVGNNGATEALRILNNGDIGIGTSSPNSSAKLDISSTTQGFLPPRMTTSERDAISSPSSGLILYNSTTSRLELNTGTSSSPNWQALTVASSNPTSITSQVFTMSSSSAVGTLASGITIDGFKFTVAYYSTSFCEPRVYNNTGASVTITYSSHTAGTTNQIKQLSDALLANNAYASLESDGLFYWSSTYTEVLTVDLLVNHANWYRASFTTYESSSPTNTKQIFIRVEKIL